MVVSGKLEIELAKNISVKMEKFISDFLDNFGGSENLDDKFENNIYDVARVGLIYGEGRESEAVAESAEQVLESLEYTTSSAGVRLLILDLQGQSGEWVGAKTVRLIAALNGKKNQAERWELEKLMAGFATFLPSEFRHMRYWALNQLMAEHVSVVEKYEKGMEWEGNYAVRTLCNSFPTEQLVEVLKWPFCGGEAEQIVLEVLEEKLAKQGSKPDFQGDVWKFVGMAPSLGIAQDVLEKAPRRPSWELAENELRQWQIDHPEAAK